MKPAVLRPEAERDLIEAVGYYKAAGGTPLGARFFGAATAALTLIQQRPAMGSLRLGELCGIPGLGSWRVSEFPLRWFYFETPDRIDLVRLLGERQDVVSILSGDD